MMDEDDINDLIQGCKTLKYKLHGVFAANNFPEKMNRNSFLIVNAATAENIGTHWLLLCRKTINFHLPIPLVSPFHRTNIYIKESSLLPTITTSINSWRINQFKGQTLNFVEFFVFLLLVFVFNAQKLVNINDNELIRFRFSYDVLTLLT